MLYRNSEVWELPAAEKKKVDEYLTKIGVKYQNKAGQQAYKRLYITYPPHLSRWNKDNNRVDKPGGMHEQLLAVLRDDKGVHTYRYYPVAPQHDNNGRPIFKDERVSLNTRQQIKVDNTEYIWILLHMSSCGNGLNPDKALNITFVFEDKAGEEKAKLEARKLKLEIEYNIAQRFSDSEISVLATAMEITGVGEMEPEQVRNALHDRVFSGTDNKQRDRFVQLCNNGSLKTVRSNIQDAIELKVVGVWKDRAEVPYWHWVKEDGKKGHAICKIRANKDKFLTLMDHMIDINNRDDMDELIVEVDKARIKAQEAATTIPA